MRINILRKINRILLCVCSLAVVLVLIPFGAYFAEYTTLYTGRVQKTELAPNIVREVYHVLTSEGWIVANVVRSSSAAARSVAVLYPEELRSAEPLSQLVSGRNDIVAAINGDFFDYATKSVLGRIIDSGRVIQTSNRSKEFAHLAVRSDSNIEIGYESGEKTRISNGAATFDIYYINKAYTYEGIATIFDGNFGEKSPGKYPDNSGETVEILVQGGVVADISNGASGFVLGGGTIDTGDYVIHASGASAAQIRKAFAVGDVLSLTLSRDIADVYTGISGGTQLVKDGKVYDFTHNILGNHPRTAVGVEKDGRTVLFVTVNGRSDSYRGIRQSELAELMIELGAHNALILDGGGSTTMLVKDPYSGETDITGYLSDGSERYVYNGLALTYSPQTTGVIHSLSLGAPEVSYYSFGERAAGVVGIPLELNVMALDTGFSEYDVSGRVSFETIGLEGTFRENTFVPSKPGDGVIIARADGKEARLNVHISEYPVRMFGEMHKSAERGYTFDFHVMTNDGYVAHLPASALNLYAKISGGSTYDAATATVVPSSDSYSGYVTFTYYVTDYDVLSLSFAMAGGILARAEAKLGDMVLAGAVQQSAGSAEPAAAPGGDRRALAMRYSVGGDKIALAERTLSAKFAEPALLSKNKNKFTIDVCGANQGRVLVQASLVPASEYRNALNTEDALKNRVVLPIVTNIDWEGWRTLELEFDFDEDYVLDEIVVRKPYVGGVNNTVELAPIYFGDVVSYSPQVYDGFLPNESHLKKKYTDYKFVNYDYSTVVYGDAYLDAGYADEDEYADALKNRFTYIEIDNSGGLIRDKFGGEQWKELVSKLAMPEKPILIQFSGTYYFKDFLERQLLLELIEKSGQPAVLVFKAYRGATDIFRKNGAFIAEINDDEALYISNKLELEIGELE